MFQCEFHFSEMNTNECQLNSDGDLLFIQLYRCPVYSGRNKSLFYLLIAIEFFTLKCSPWSKKQNSWSDPLRKIFFLFASFKRRNEEKMPWNATDFALRATQPGQNEKGILLLFRTTFNHISPFRNGRLWRILRIKKNSQILFVIEDSDLNQKNSHSNQFLS